MASKTPRGLLLIGALKLLKALALFALGTSLLSILHRDAAEAVRHWSSALGLHAHARLAEALVAKITGLDHRTMRDLGVGSLVYATVFAVEGLGLFLGKSWAEYLTTGVTISFLPIEVYEWLAHPSPLKALVTLINVAVVTYLMLEIRRGRANESRGQRAAVPRSG